MVEDLQFVAYRIGEQQFAIEIHRLYEVLSYCPVTPLPGAPPFLEGMIDLRGELVPVIDLRKKLGARECRNEMQTRILIVGYFIKNWGLSLIQPIRFTQFLWSPFCLLPRAVNGFSQ
jgi:purine-binding chemotaxis protein CheW